MLLLARISSLGTSVTISEPLKPKEDAPNLPQTAIDRLTTFSYLRFGSDLSNPDANEPNENPKAGEHTLDTSTLESFWNILSTGID